MIASAWFYPDTVVADDLGFAAGDGTWSNLSNLVGNTASEADLLISSGFVGKGARCSNLKTAGAVDIATALGDRMVFGIEVEVVRGETGLGEARDNRIYLSTANDAVIGENKADTVTEYPSSAATAAYGGELDTWTLRDTMTQSAIDAAIKTTNFGVSVQAKEYGLSNDITANIATVRVRFYVSGNTSESVSTADQNLGDVRDILNSSTTRRIDVLGIADSQGYRNLDGMFAAFARKLGAQYGLSQWASKLMGFADAANIGMGFDVADAGELTLNSGAPTDLDIYGLQDAGADMGVLGYGYKLTDLSAGTVAEGMRVDADFGGLVGPTIAGAPDAYVTDPVAFNFNSASMQYTATVGYWPNTDGGSFSPSMRSTSGDNSMWGAGVHDFDSGDPGYELFYYSYSTSWAAMEDDEVFLIRVGGATAFGPGVRAATGPMFLLDQRLLDFTEQTGFSFTPIFHGPSLGLEDYATRLSTVSWSAIKHTLSRIRDDQLSAASTSDVKIIIANMLGGNDTGTKAQVAAALDNIIGTIHAVYATAVDGHPAWDITEIQWLNVGYYPKFTEAGDAPYRDVLAGAVASYTNVSYVGLNNHISSDDLDAGNTGEVPDPGEDALSGQRYYDGAEFGAGDSHLQPAGYDMVASLALYAISDWELGLPINTAATGAVPEGDEIHLYFKDRDIGNASGVITFPKGTGRTNYSVSINGVDSTTDFTFDSADILDGGLRLIFSYSGVLDESDDLLVSIESEFARDENGLNNQALENYTLGGGAMPTCKPNRATGTRAAVIIQDETCWGEISELSDPVVDQDALGWEVREENIQNAINEQESELIRSDRMRSASQQGNQRPGGTFSGELQPHGPWPLILRHALNNSPSVAGSGPYVHTIPGAINLPEGLTLEKQFGYPDGTTQYLVYTGGHVSRFNFRVEAEGIIKSEAELIFKQEIDNRTESIDTDPTYPADNEPYNSFQGALMLDSNGDGTRTAIATIQTMEMTIANLIDGDQFAIDGSPYRADLPIDQRQINGSMNAFFTSDNFALYERYKDNASLSLELTLTRGTNVMVFLLPHIKMVGGNPTPRIEGRRPLSLALEFKGFRDDVSGTDVQVTITNDDSVIGTAV